MVAGVVETQICEVLHILLDDLRDVLNPLGGGLGRVGERFPPSVHLRQGALERRDATSTRKAVATSLLSEEERNLEKWPMTSSDCIIFSPPNHAYQPIVPI